MPSRQRKAVHTAIGNTIVRSTKQGGSDSASGVVLYPGAMRQVLSENSIVDIEQVVAITIPRSLVFYHNNLSMDWTSGK